MSNYYEELKEKWLKASPRTKENVKFFIEKSPDFREIHKKKVTKPEYENCSPSTYSLLETYGVVSQRKKAILIKESDDLLEKLKKE